MSLILNGTDRHGSPHLSLNSGVLSTSAWSPFGATPRQSSSLPGFNGERADPVSGVTHLGNGYRAYSPVLRRFTCPDSESPFGIGGINPYAYCEGDPINGTDPSGHGLITWLIRKVLSIGIRLGIKAAQAEALSASVATVSAIETGVEAGLSLATGVASGITRATGHPDVSKALGWASMGLGLAATFGTAEIIAPKIRDKVQGLCRKAKRVPAPELMSYELTEYVGETLAETRVGPSASITNLPAPAYDAIFSQLDSTSTRSFFRAISGSEYSGALEESLRPRLRRAVRSDIKQNMLKALRDFDNATDVAKTSTSRQAMVHEAWLQRGSNGLHMDDIAEIFHRVNDSSNLTFTAQQGVHFQSWVGFDFIHTHRLPGGFNGSTLAFNPAKGRGFVNPIR
ncbi:RHS repeat-associated core domain-containing protein [Trabulsiella odontotermitis]|uniref:RHS repeat-associated core domain-containing protein n=1 Tax=Trabulsiella odontotermitis TaxID=379893 RepID=UPI0006767D4B|nr:RHS repeat-associated core domain-containing protein [Trabulsiella odontotermitis]